MRMLLHQDKSNGFNSMRWGQRTRGETTSIHTWAFKEPAVNSISREMIYDARPVAERTQEGELKWSSQLSKEQPLLTFRPRLRCGRSPLRRPSRCSPLQRSLPFNSLKKFPLSSFSAHDKLNPIARPQPH